MNKEFFLTIFLCMAFAAAICYPFFSFIGGSFDPFMWTGNTAKGYAALSIIIGLGMSIAALSE